MKVIKNVVERAKAPTPKFFKVLRTVGLVLAGISGTLIAAPVALPATIVTVAGYLAVAGGVLSAVSQMTVLAEPQQTASSSFDYAQDDGSGTDDKQSDDSKINSG